MQHIYSGDISSDVSFSNSIAVDTEAMGLNNYRDRLCVVQIADSEGNTHIIKFNDGGVYDAPNLVRILGDNNLLKIYHYARFDVAIIYKYLGVWATPLYCTKIASKLARTYSSYHGLKELCRELIGVQLSKGAQSSDWGKNDLSEEQLKYANHDVIFLHEIMRKLNDMLLRESRNHLLQPCLDFVQHRALLDLEGWIDTEIHSYN